MSDAFFQVIEFLQDGWAQLFSTEEAQARADAKILKEMNSAIHMVYPEEVIRANFEKLYCNLGTTWFAVVDKTEWEKSAGDFHLKLFPSLSLVAHQIITTERIQKHRRERLDDNGDRMEDYSEPIVDIEHLLIQLNDSNLSERLVHKKDNIHLELSRPFNKSHETWLESVVIFDHILGQFTPNWSTRAKMPSKLIEKDPNP